MIYYLVNNKKFFNHYLAYHESFTTGHPITFYCNDSENDLLDWTQEPPETFEELMDHHAHKLRNKYERLVLCWSGGTDSHTIYNVFKRNGIRIDEIIIKYSKNVWDIYPVAHVDWMIKNHWDPTTKITVFDEYQKNIRQSTINSDEWLFENYGMMRNKYYASASIGPETTFLCENSHNGHNWGLIVGFEKPFVSQIDGRWYTQQRDQMLLATLGQPRLECFFLDPVLNLKQSHMAKRVLKQFKKAPTEPRPNGHYSSNVNAYRLWATVVGRHDELSIGTSAAQKQVNGKVQKFQFDPTVSIDRMDTTYIEPKLLMDIKQQDSTALNFVNGWYNLASNKEFYGYLKQYAFNGPDNLLHFKSIWSKAYDLGP
jgi:hypothetical protein